jgi:hypothetical protein
MRQMHSFNSDKNLGTAKTLIVVMAMLVFHFGTIAGQVATLQDWTNLYHGAATTPQNVAYSVPSGSDANRVLLVAVASTSTTTIPLSVTLTYGGQTLLPANGDMGLSTMQHTALYYLNEAGLDAAATDILEFTVSGGTINITDVWAAVFDYVNQDAPLTDSQTYSSVSATVTDFAFSTPLTVNAYNQAVEVISSRAAGFEKWSVISYATGWQMIDQQLFSVKSGMSGVSIRNGIANRNIPLQQTEDPSPTNFNPAGRASMTALSLNYEPPPPPTIQASDIIFSDVTSSSMTISWTNGDGTNRIVLMKAVDPVDSDPVFGTTYTASNFFGNGSEIGAGNFVVFNGTGNSVTVLNLDAKTTYHVAIYEFSGPPGLEFYLEPPARGSQMTGPETALTDDYRSNGSGNWETPEIWQTFDGEAWVTAGTAPNSLSGAITIRYGHEIAVTANLTVDQVVITASGKVSVNPGVTLTIADGDDDTDFFVRGTLINAGTITATGILAFDSGAAYQHTGNGGAIPAAVWDANSLCLVTGVINNTLTGFGQSFGNFTWNSPGQTSVVPMNANVTVKGNFTLTGTGTGRLALIDDNTSRTLSISGNYIQTGGIFDFNYFPPSTSTAYLTLAGNFTFTGGTITESSNLGRGSVVFNGPGTPQVYTAGGTLSKTIDFTVNSGAFLQMGTGANPSVLIGSDGTFTLSAGARLGITSTSGITKSTVSSSSGNIQVTGTRTFSENATYIYNGSAGQSTNNGLPSTVSNLIFSNTGGVVTFTATHTIANFSINSGARARLGDNRIHATEILMLGGVGQVAGSYGHPDSEAEFTNDVFFAPSTGIINNSPLDGVWLGITTDWNTGSNWIGGVPTSGTNAKIYSFTANQPLISGMPTAVSNSITINPGASLTIGPSGSATVTSLINNGTLTLGSDATGIASLIIDEYSGSGIENIQMYLTGGGNESNYPYHYISSPVQSLSADVFVSGTERSWDLMAYYEDLAGVSQHEGWVAWDGYDYSLGDYPENPGDYRTFNTLVPGKGYNVYFYEPSVVKTFGGDLNISDETEQLSYTGVEDNSEVKGWNLLGNPFSSSLDWDAIAESLPEGGLIENAIYFTRNNTWVSYVGGVGTPGDVTGNIPPMQGFFVKTNTSGQSITMPLAARVHSTQNRYKGEGKTVPLIRLRIENNKYSDETVIRFDDKAKNTFDVNLDARKFDKSGFRAGLWTMNGPVSYSINSIPFPETETQIRAGINISESGSYRITASQLHEIGDYNIYLIDKLAGTTINLRNTPSLSFTASRGLIEDRFVIKITSMLAGPENSNVPESNFNIYTTREFINIQTLSDEWDGKSGSVEVSDLFGRTISRINNTEFWKNSLIQLPSTGPQGVYFVIMKSGVMRHVGRVVVK